MTRPEVEEFIRLCGGPDAEHTLRMPDSDVIDLCNYIMDLETRLATARAAERERCAKIADDENTQNGVGSAIRAIKDEL